MTLPIRTLPIVERWHCNGCGLCCYGTMFVLSDEEVRRIRSQGWENHPALRGQAVLTRVGWGRRYRLAKRPDGGCVFLTPENLCRIHSEFGEEAKPLVCRLFPLQLVPLEKYAHVTLRRFCPTAARDDGHPIEELVRDSQRLLEQALEGVGPAPPPAAARRRRLGWEATLSVAGALSRMMTDARFPLVRRLVHGLELCAHLDACRLNRVEGSSLSELLAMLADAAARDAGVYFARRQPPRTRSMMLLRQTALECIRLHPLLKAEASLRARLAMIRAAWSWAFGKGKAPVFGLPFPPATFEEIDRPLGPLDPSVHQPVAAFFEAAAASLRYALPGRPGWSITESFRALALAYAAGMYLLRFECGPDAPTLDHTTHAVMTLDRSLSYAVLAGSRRRVRVNALATGGELQRLVAWLAR